MLSVVTALAMAGGATYAFFSDVATSSNNTFSTGTLSMQVRDNNQGFTDAISESFASPSNWVPGEAYTDFVCFQNNGTVNIQDIYFNITQSGTTGDTGLKNFINAEKVELGLATADECATAGTPGVGLTDFTPLVLSRFDGTIGDADSKVTLAELITDVTGTDKDEDDLLDGEENLLPPGQRLKFRVTWRFDPSATGSVSGASIITNMSFTGTQNENQ